MTSSLTPLLLLLLLPSLSTASDILTPDRPLADNEILVSANGSFTLGFFSPAPDKRYVGIWYTKVSVQTVVWVANRNHPILDTAASLSVNSDGSMTIADNSSTVVWSSGLLVSAVSKPVAQILDSGNFVVRGAESPGAGPYAWQSFDYPTDTLLPGMKLGWNLTSGLNRNLTAWASMTDPSPGPYALFVDTAGDPQIFLSAGSTRTWRTGPWIGAWFSGIPEMTTYGMLTFEFVQNAEEIYYQYRMKDPTVISRLIVNQTGSEQRLVWLDQPKTWTVFRFAPKDQCDSVSPCGQFGMCNPNDSPICHCLQGFVPRNPKNWALRDGSNGCIRDTPLDCRNGTDGFVTVSEAKLPDTASSTVDMSLSLDQCRAKCLSNCSCTAYASADINGTGCLIWTANLTDIRVLSFGGPDFYVRLNAADLGSPMSDQSHGETETLAIVLPSVIGLLLLAWIGYCCIRRKNRRRRRLRLESRDLELPLYDMDSVIAATDSFSIANKLGEGGFGPVFKGVAEDGQEIAVKRLAKTSVQGVEEFRNEMELIAKLQHRNLVRLLGCCIQGEEKMLIYEYMPNKSLDAFLFDKVKCALLDWQTRYNIILGIARGLLYLHQDSRFRIIHRDLKASNILLDKDMNPKISDFGMARIFGGDDTQANTRKVVGTYGYMSPEYAMDGIFSVKSDVFSFGVLVLEIISGKKNRGFYLPMPDTNLLGHAWSLWREGKSSNLVDESIGYSYPLAEALRCIWVGLLCVQERPVDRPTMSSVVLMLGSESASLPQPKQPGFVTTRGPFECNSSASKQASFTLNEISVTMLEGR